MTRREYWAECLADAASEAGVSLTTEQLALLAEAVDGAYENFGMAFYSPPPSDRLLEVERAGAVQIEALKREFEQYQVNAERAVREALKLRPDTRVSIGEFGEVYAHGGRTERVQ